MAEFSFIVSRDSTIPKERARALKRIRAILACFPSGVSDRVNCFLHGLTLGWGVSGVIGLADADEVRALLPRRPDDVISAVPFGPEGVVHPEIEALTDDEVPDDLWFEFWMGIKRHSYFFEQRDAEMPERHVFAWLGFLRGELEARGISEAEYNKLRSMLPPVDDDLTPLVASNV